MSPAAKALIGIGLFIFMAPICIGSGMCGGCIAAAFLSPTGDAGATAAMFGGLGIGLAAAIAIPILIVRNLAARSGG